MSEPWPISRSDVYVCLRHLQAAEGPTTAVELADKLMLTGSRETRRRKIRAIVRRLRDGGAMIVATLHGGYWLTDDESLWAQYLDGRQIDAKRILGDAYRKKMVTDRKGQGMLFVPGPQTGIG